ncbi:MAG: hypothetical protein NVSMB9_21790 [Isosphaeraceae bacterium]
MNGQISRFRDLGFMTLQRTPWHRERKNEAETYAKRDLFDPSVTSLTINLLAHWALPRLRQDARPLGRRAEG